MNVQSILSIEKRLSFCSYMSMLSPAIACLTETWLEESVNDSAVFIGNPYSVIVRSDRTHGHHGGILIAFHNNFLKDIEIKYSSKSENDCVVLFTYASLTLCVVLFYLPPLGSQFYVKPIVAELRIRAIMRSRKQITIEKLRFDTVAKFRRF